MFDVLDFSPYFSEQGISKYLYVCSILQAHCCNGAGIKYVFDAFDVLYVFDVLDVFDQRY
jgi:hypothetical protein